jgi:hypothetical protein
MESSIDFFDIAMISSGYFQLAAIEFPTGGGAGLGDGWETKDR